MPEVTTYANLRALTVQPDRLLLTKLYAPPARADRVPRPRLTTRLQRSLQHKLLLLSAPAGSGKTTALSEWVATENNTQAAIAWVSLDAGDNDPVRFIMYLIAALQTVQAGAGGMALALLEAPHPPEVEAVLTTLINELRDTPNDLALVLDDAHVLTAPDVQHVLAFLIDHLPPHIHLIIASRTELPLGLAKLRARNQVLEMHASDLRFTPEETGTFFKQIMGVELAPEDIETLSASTEGWAAGLQLAALSLRGDRDISQRIRTFTGNDRYILDFLVTEVLQQQPADLQAFLLETSILQRFNAPLCSTLTNRADAQSVLEQLEQANLFIVPLDNVRGWYRYHHLFAELLRDQLRCTQPDRINVLHGRACGWYAAHGFTREAIHHALAAQNFDKALELIRPIAPQMIARNENAALADWFSVVPGEQLLRDPSLAVKYVWALIGTARRSEANTWLEQIEQAAGNLLDEARGEVRAAQASLAIQDARFAPAIDLLDEAETLIPKEATLLRAIIATNRGVAYMFVGETAKAEAAYHCAAALSQAAGHPRSMLTALNNLGILQAQQGKLHRAVATYRRALSQAAALLDDTHPQQAMSCMVHISLAETLYEWNDLDEALAEAQRGTLPNPQCVHDNSVRIAGCMITASIQRARGDSAAASATLAEAEQFSEGGPAYIVSDFHALRARFAIWQGNFTIAQQWAAAQELPLQAEPGNLWRYAYRYFTLARLLIRQEPRQAIALLDRLVAALQAQGQMSGVIEGLVLLALAQRRRGNPEAARRCVQQALVLAAPQGHVRVFVDEGTEMRALLNELLPSLAQHHQELIAHVNKLLAAFSAAAQASTTQSDGQEPAAPRLALVEPLSERECEILRLIDQGLSNQEIAQRMIVAVSTIKWHINHIYAKLDAHSRTQALARARELRLL